MKHRPLPVALEFGAAVAATTPRMVFACGAEALLKAAKLQ